MSKWKTFAIALVLCLTLLDPTAGQPPRTYEPMRMTPEYRAARDAVYRQDYEKAAELFLRIGEQNPGTTLGATGLLNAAGFVPEEQKRSVYRKVVSGYPRSRFAAEAGLELITMDYGDWGTNNWRDWVTAADRLAVSFGGPSFARAMGGSRSRLAREVRALPEETQVALTQIYVDTQVILSYRLGQHAQAMDLALFNREAFAGGEWDGKLEGAVEDELEFLKYGQNQPGLADIINPTLKIWSPREGQTKGPRPRIRLEAYTGDTTVTQVDLERLQIRLDGQDLKPFLVVRAKFDRRLKLGKPLETLRLEARPPQRLTPGNHTLEVVVIAHGYKDSVPNLGATRKTWTFRVAGNRDDREDECDDWGDEQEWLRDD